MSIKIALIGNPNCGKTTLFNTLTKSKQKIGNWPGVTVEKKNNKFYKNKNIEIIDLPGLYSLQPFSPEEKISSEFIKNLKFDIIINVISATNLERSLYLTLQLLETKVPMVVAITMLDVLKKNGGEINFSNFSKIFKCSTIPIKKNDETSINNLIETALLKLKPSFDSQKFVPFQKTEIFSNKNHEKTCLDQKKLLNCKNEKILENSIINERYNFISANINKLLTTKPTNKSSTSEKIDKILTNRWLAIPSFISIISLIYFISIPIIGKPISEWLDLNILKNWLIPTLQSVLTKFSIQTWLKNLICDGIVSGVGSVLIFIPQLFILFFLLCFLEESGYMTRITFITDKIFDKFGLYGQSLISFLVSSSCGVNGIIATKTIKDPKTRLITMATTTFIPCSAKIPVIAAISSLFLQKSWLIAPIAYLICFLAIIISSMILKSKTMETHQNNQFFMEILPYQIPSIKHMLTDSLTNIKLFISKALTVVLIASVLIWTATNIGFCNGHLCLIQANRSILAQMSKILTPIFKPLGFSNWQTISATISGLFAKENIVNTMEVITSSCSDGTVSIASLFNNQAAAFSFLVFNLLCAPCCVAIAAVFKQTNSIKLTLKVAAFQTIVAWCFSAITFFVAKLFV